MSGSFDAGGGAADFDPGGTQAHPDDAGAAATASLAISCNRCRKAKLRCSRERPGCQHCRKAGLDCVYESKRGKPGLKGGAVENIHRRLDALERAVQDRDWSSSSSGSLAHREGGSSSHPAAAERVLALLARELPRLVGGLQSAAPAFAPLLPPRPELGTERKRQRIEEPSEDESDGEASAPAEAAAATAGQHEAERTDLVDDPAAEDSDDDDTLRLPATSLESLEPVVAKYFSHIHPWIPMLHQDRFRHLISQGATELAKIDLIIFAMIVSTAKFFRDEDLDFDIHAPAWRSSRIRRWVISNAMDRPSVESLQTLIIMAFNDIGDGNALKAWPIVGSLTRTVEYMQLTKEPDEDGQQQRRAQPLCRPFETLPPARDWTELEERRRVFWNVFVLDRLCNVTMGWSTSLTSDDVRRRLPADGILWRKQTPAATPYLGIWDKSAARIGNPMAVTSSRYQAAPAPSDQPVLESGDGDSPGPAIAGAAETAGIPGLPHPSAAADMSRVGAFAYCVEATESMSRVTSYFLQQPLAVGPATATGSRLSSSSSGSSGGSSISSPHLQRILQDSGGGGGGDLNSWLTRFKELDLRLVHWKMLLPQKWKTGGISSSNVVGTSSSTSTGSHASNTRMDPNLTLAHVTHNASMILLHQPIAYPDAAGPPHHPLARHGRRLPSPWSAETCCAAAVEIATITHNYLRVTPPSLPVTSQFPFCLYVAARMLLVHWRHDEPGSRLLDEFWALVRGLDEMSRRWSGAPVTEQRGPRREDDAPLQQKDQPASNRTGWRRKMDLAARYAAKLRELHGVCAADESFRIDTSAYTREMYEGELTGSPGHAASPARAQTTEDQQPQGETSYPSQWAPHNGHILLPPIHPRGARGRRPHPHRSSTLTRASNTASTYSHAHRTTAAPTAAQDTPSSHSMAGAAGSQILLDQPVAMGLQQHHPQQPLNQNQGPHPGPGASPVPPTNAPQMLDQYFVDMDRVISFDDGSMFATGFEGGVGW